MSRLVLGLHFSRNTLVWSGHGMSARPALLPSAITWSSHQRTCIAPYHGTARASTDTIYAPATAPGRAGVAVIRISGPNAAKALMTLDRTRKRLPRPRTLALVALEHPVTRISLDDRALAAWFPGPKSFTGEDTVELHVHGGTAVVAAVLQGVAACNNHSRSEEKGGSALFRMAERGEFAMRALANGKLDLAEVEGLKDLINAETEVQRQLASQQASGHFSTQIESWRREIVTCMGHAEAQLDFGEDEQFDSGQWQRTSARISSLSSSIAAHLATAQRGEIVRSGIRTTLFGVANAGKSSLINHLARRHVALVAATPGTTRDVVEARVDVAGYPVLLGDTAGLRTDTDDAVERAGVALARNRLANESDLRIWVVDLAASPLADQIALAAPFPASTGLVVLNKTDCVDSHFIECAKAEITDAAKGVPMVMVSMATGTGLADLDATLATVLRDTYGAGLANSESATGMVVTNARHRAHLAECVAALDACVAAAEHDLVIAAEELRRAAQSMGRITGRVDVEDVLDVVFGDFCIGK
ncbi:hypothetical protein BC828DRAFT_386462 [Blastocladiella britannica]|nr:hypothetical protein BC828DRAFT_386462 [Blastocladiella britannica]